jgi:anti-sigma factor RsiW
MNPSENDIQGFADDLIEPERRAEVEAYLKRDAEAAERVAAYREQNAQLRALFNPVLDEAIPQRLTMLAPRRSLTRFAIAASWVILGATIGWGAKFLIGEDPGRAVTFAHRAAIAHAVYSPEVRHPVEVGADQQEHLVRWLSKRLGADLRPPVLVASGYELVGGRLLPGDRGAVAQFMYQDAKGRRLTLYVSKMNVSQGDTAFRFSRENGVSVFYWVDGALGYALSADLPKHDLLGVATAVYKQLNP